MSKKENGSIAISGEDTIVIITLTLGICIAYTVWCVPKENNFNTVLLNTSSVVPLFTLISGTINIIKDLIMLMYAKLFRDKVRQEGIEEGIKQGVKQGVKQGIEQGVEQGINKERQNWIAWNKRRVEAEENGQEFNEPPPTHIIDDIEDN